MFGAGGRLGRVFLYSAQKKLGGQLWSKAGPASRIPQLGLCKLNRPHEPGGGPEQEVDLNKKKKIVNTSIYPDEVIERLARCFYPAILECFNSEEGQRPFAAWQAEQARPTSKEKQDVPAGECPALHTDRKRLFSDKAHPSGCVSFFLPFGQSVTICPAQPSGTASGRELLRDSAHQRKRKIRTLLLLEKVWFFRLYYNHGGHNSGCRFLFCAAV